jgi:hypothetical protein
MELATGCKRVNHDSVVSGWLQSMRYRGVPVLTVSPWARRSCGSPSRGPPGAVRLCRTS